MRSLRVWQRLCLAPSSNSMSMLLTLPHPMRRIKKLITLVPKLHLGLPCRDQRRQISRSAKRRAPKAITRLSAKLCFVRSVTLLACKPYLARYSCPPPPQWSCVRKCAPKCNLGTSARWALNDQSVTSSACHGSRNGVSKTSAFPIWRLGTRALNPFAASRLRVSHNKPPGSGKINCGEGLTRRREAAKRT